MRISLLILCLVAGSTVALPILDLASKEWAAFKNFNKKIYKNTGEELFRLKIYLKNKLDVVTHNLKFKAGLENYEVEMNHFGDLLDNEYKTQTAGYKPSKSRTRSFDMYVRSGKRLPAQVDWRTRNAVVPPRNQGDCNSCWTFSTTGALEGQLAIKTGRLIPLSQQYLVDCARPGGSCDPGTMDEALKFIQRNGGMVSEAAYPYRGVPGACRFNRRDVVVQVNGYTEIAEGNDLDLQDAIANVGPISVAVDISGQMFGFYKSGVFSPPAQQCSSANLNHAVLAVGYGVERGREYWLIKNSWGSTWGDQGYIKIWKNGRNLCGVSTDPSFPHI